MRSSIITDKLKDNQNNQCFLKDIVTRNCKYKHILDEKLKTTEICRRDKIVLPIVIDTEYTSNLGNIDNLTVDKLERRGNKQLEQINALDSAIKKYTDIEGIMALASLKASISYKDLDNDKLKRIRKKPSLHLSTQIKHIFHDNGVILLNPKLKNFYESHITDQKYIYPYYKKTHGAHIEDYLKLKGFDVSIARHVQDDKDDFKKLVEENHYPTCTIKLYAYFLLADFSKIFEGDFFQDILCAFQKRKIAQHRRLNVNGWHKKWSPQYLITINGLTYKLVFDLVDLSAVQGQISFNNMLINLDMDNTDKGALDDVKDNMLLPMITRPEEFQKYALGDLNVYEAYKKHDNLNSDAYKELGLDNFIIESKLTTGSSVNDLQTAVLLDYLKFFDRDKQSLKFLYDLTYTASPSYLRSYERKLGHKREGACLRKQVGSKIFGGRCYKNRLLHYASSAYFALCDIDIAGAYPTVASSLDYYFGNPVTLNFTKYKVTLREFLKFYEKDLVKRSFKLVVETDPKNPLKIEQDIFPSWHQDSIRINNSIISKQDNQYILSSIDLENTPTSIYTTELSNTPMSWDDIDLMNELSKKQREELLDKSYLITATFYPASFECKTVEDLKEKIGDHEKTGEGKYLKTMTHSTIDNDDFERSNYWHRVNFGELIMFHIIQLRQKYKKTNLSLSYLYKLIGNTIYGVNVSPHFINSNIVLAANITGMCRNGMWYSEKALNICQTITDGGIFFLNEVIHLMSKKIDTSLLVRNYQKPKNYYSENRKWKIRPITKNGEKIDYHKGKGWLIDGEYYGCDRDLLVQLTNEYEIMKKSLNSENPLLMEKKEELDVLNKSVSILFKKINDLSVEHVAKIFSKNDLFNGMFRKVKVDEHGIGYKDSQGKYIIEEVKGLFKFEVKNLCDFISFHGSADYLYENLEGKTIKKMRGYDSSKEIIAWSLNDEGVLTPQINHYKDISPVEKFLKDIRDNPSNVALPLPYSKTAILKTAEYSKNYKKTYSYSEITPGHDFFEMIRIPVLTMRFKFKNYQQHKNWVSYCNKLKRRYGGLSLEIFYMNNDGTIDNARMNDEIDTHIANGIMHPKDLYDKHDHLKRNLQNLKVEKNRHIQNYIKLVNSAKNLMRISVVGVERFIHENYKIVKEHVNVIPAKTLYNIKEIDFPDEHLTTYSDDSDFRDHETASSHD